MWAWHVSSLGSKRHLCALLQRKDLGALVVVRTTSSVVLGDLDIGWRQQIHVARNSLHGATEPVANATREIDEAATQLAVDIFQIHDHRLAALEDICDLLSIVEA